MSDERLSKNLLSVFEKGVLPDVTLVAQGREIPAHRALLAAQSEYFLRHFSSGTPGPVLELPHKYKVVHALVRFIYFAGPDAFRELDPHDCLDLVLLAEDLGVGALDANDVSSFVCPPRNASRDLPGDGASAPQSKLTPQNCIQVLQHEGLRRQPALQAGICEFVGDHFLGMMDTMQDQLLTIPADMLAPVLKSLCHHVADKVEVERIVQFCLQHTQLESACDLLRETKQWTWGSAEASLLRAPSNEEAAEGVEWTIRGVKSALESTPARIVVGEFFEWCVRLDYGVEGKLRIVYESTTSRDAGAVRCMNTFPAATFAWRVVFRGQDVFNEKPVFICFPENVSLHWSTTLPVSISDLGDDDEISIMVNMAENPMISLILYYFSADLKSTIFSEDILNRLPHIEYRCLSSYSLVKTHSGAG